MRRLVAGFLVVLTLAGLSFGAAAAERRVALVIGNGAYTGTGLLTNTTNDAQAIGDALAGLGFEVTLATNVDRRSAIATIDAFSKTLVGADIAFLFYAGHGMQIGGQNFLLPVDVDISSERALRYSAIDIGEVVADMERSARVALVVLDACRDNPYVEAIARTVQKDRAARPLQGLTMMELSGRGAIVAYAAAAGEVASDGSGKHSPYTEALLGEIAAPGVEVGLMFRRAAGRVLDATSGKQRPELLVRLVDEVYLKPAPAVEVAALLALPEAASEPAAAKPVAVADAGKVAAAPVVVRSARADGFFGDKAIHKPDWAGAIAVPAAPDWTPAPAVPVAEIDGNDSYGRAQPIPLAATIAARISPRADNDWFRFEVPIAGELRLSTNAAPANLDLYARVWNSDRQVVRDWQGAPRQGGAIDATYALPGPGEYWIELTDGNNDADSLDAFDLTVGFTPANDPFEPNNGIGVARPIPLPARFAPAVFPRGDTDWYLVWAPEPGLLTLLAEKIAPNLDVVMRLWTLDGAVLRDWQVPPRPGGDTVLEAEIAEPGVYAIEIADGNGDAENTATFQFSATFEPVEDLAEPNNSFGTATLQDGAASQRAGGRNGETRRAAIFPRGDADWLAIDVGHPGELKIDVAGSPPNLDLYLRVLNANKDVIRDWTGPTRHGGDVSAYADLPAPGRYFIELTDGNNDASSPELFEIAYSFTPQPDQFEPNNGMASAAPLTPGGEIPFNILPRGDADWFRVEAPSPGELVVTIDEGPDNLDLNYRIWNSDRQVIRDWVPPYRKGGLTEGFADIPRAGVYFIEVVDGNNDERSIRHATLRTTFTATADPLEPNDSYGAARPMTPGEPHAAFILPRGDVDWYELDAPRAGEFIVTIDEVDPALDIWIRLWDANGAAGGWFGPPRPGGVTEATIPAPAAGRYRLELTDGNNDARSPRPFRVAVAFR